jgi:hypothetical protein
MQKIRRYTTAASPPHENAEKAKRYAETKKLMKIMK